MLTCGVDVGGTKISGGVVAEDGTLVDSARVRSPATDTAAIADAIADMVNRFAERHDIEAVGVGAAGYVDRARRTVVFAPNLAWRHVDLSAEIAHRVGKRVVIENDANAAAWGEYRFGAAADVDHLLLVTVGTGIGGGLVLDGALVRGASGAAGEVGHLRLVPGGHPCGCGNRGCLEQYGSGTALVRDARSAATDGSPDARSLLDRVDGDPQAITGRVITEAARDGDRFAVGQLAALGRHLGEGITSLAAVLDPAVIVIGGGVSDAGDLLLDPLRETFTAHRPGRSDLPIRLAHLGNDAGLIGVADLARR